MIAAHIALVAYEVDRAYCEGRGDSTVPPWPDASDKAREAAYKAVQQILDDANFKPKTPRDQLLCAVTRAMSLL